MTRFIDKYPVVACKRSLVFLSLAVLLSSLTACASSPAAKNWEQSLAADPRLQNNSQNNPLSKPTALTTAGGNSQQASQSTAVQLPNDFPPSIPKYPGAQVLEVTPASNASSLAQVRFLTTDPSNFISSFYQSEFQKNNWEILEKPNDEAGGTFAARQKDLQVKVTIKPKTVTGNANTTPTQPQTATDLLIEYTRSNTDVIGRATVSPSPSPSPSPQIESTLPQPGNPEFIGPILPESAQPIVTNTPPANTPTVTATGGGNIPQTFTDINKAAQQVQKYIQDLAQLGVLTATSANTNKSNTSTTNNLFEPGKNITRREYARWLVAANNAMYANNPAKQIRLAVETSQPAFSDLSAKDPDFGAIQGLAEAGLIPSPLSGDSTNVLFRPDAPLTREQLILWKIPLDTRQALPNANLEAVKQTWGFQDVGKIDPKALRAILADHQNGEQSNIRRVFGFTTLFQPKKPVTRAEAATSLWYFGTQGEGISAAEALKLKR